MIKVNATIRRLSDEEPDPIEHEDSSAEKLTPQQREIIEAHLSGYNYHDLAVTQKYWRYHFAAAVAKIRKELKL